MIYLVPTLLHDITSVKYPQQNSANSYLLITQRDNIHQRTHDVCICHHDDAICSRNSKIVLYQVRIEKIGARGSRHL